GIINGTTNYILTRMQREGGDFEPILKDAQRLGYAEADPTADVDGLDAADKIAILASLAFGGRIKLDQIHCEGIRQVSAADIDYAQQLGFVIKLLAIAQRNPDPDTPEAPESLQVRVHPTLVPLDHPLATVNDVFNAILIEGEPLGQVMFYGPGAGQGATASAVVSDIVSIVAALKAKSVQPKIPANLHPLMACPHQHYCTISPMSELISRFYVRIIAKDVPGVIGKLGTCFGRYDVSLESVVQIDRQHPVAEIVAVTHEVREGNFQSALEEIRTSPEIDSLPSLLRAL
ncbi:MAG: homoserine dehydrogenase, partial [Cyanobacteria bacterium P01_D01_bin.128]